MSYNFNWLLSKISADIPGEELDMSYHFNWLLSKISADIPGEELDMSYHFNSLLSKISADIPLEELDMSFHFNWLLSKKSDCHAVTGLDYVSKQREQEISAKYEVISQRLRSQLQLLPFIRHPGRIDKDRRNVTQIPVFYLAARPPPSPFKRSGGGNWVTVSWVNGFTVNIVYII